MIRNISYTVFFRVLTMLCSAAVVILTTNLLFDEGRGEISLFLTDVMLVLMISDYIGGSGLVYFTPRKSFGSLLFPSYLWAVLVCLLLPSLLVLAGQVPDGLEIHLYLLSLLNCLGSVHILMLLGQEKIFANSSLTFLKSLLTLVAAAIVLVVWDQTTVSSFIEALYPVYGSIAVLSFLALPLGSFRMKEIGLLKSIRDLWQIGKYGQSANVLQFLNYRFSFYAIEWFLLAMFHHQAF